MQHLPSTPLEPLDAEEERILASLPLDFHIRIMAGDSAVFGPDDLFLGWRSDMENSSV